MAVQRSKSSLNIVQHGIQFLQDARDMISNIIYTDCATLFWINRGYYMAGQRNEISFQVLKNLLQASAVTESNIFEFFSISKQPCNVLCIV